MPPPAPLNIHRVDLNLFVIFEAIYRLENLTRASESLHLSQPAVSHALSRLRERFNDPLFERQGKSMKPTPLAQNIIHDVRLGLSSLEATLFKGSEFDPATDDRTFNIVLPDVLEATFIHRLATRVLPIAPHLKLASIRIPRPDIEQALMQGKIDFAIDIHFPVADAIQHKELGKEEMAVICRRGHPLLDGKKQQLTLDDYLAANHILVTNRFDGFGVEDYALSKLGKTRKVSMACQHFYAANRVVSDTDLLLTLPRGYGELLARNENNQLLPLPFKIAPMEMHMYWLAKNNLNPGNAWLKAQIEALLLDVGATR